ncbi:MAG: prepilin peptidase [Candidatus Omnitrophica bacterium]|nr:prepilin peptidase [Candidatus Omnitrophota bacterium]
MVIDGIGIFIFILGAMIGSFLNVCIVRMPLEQSIVKPRSHCFKCNKTIPWYDNIPLLSYWILGGKCRFCKAPFSIIYWLVEVLTAVVFYLMYLYFGLSALYLPYVFMMSCFIVATFVDFAHRIIPDEISIGGMVFGLIFSFFIPQMQGLSTGNSFNWIIHLQSLGWSMVGVIVGGGSIYLMGLIGDILFKKESMGGGDVKLLAMVGAFMGWKLAILTFFLAPLFGAVFGIIEKIRTKDSTIAYGPFLVLGAIISLFWGERIIVWILNGYRIN